MDNVTWVLLQISFPAFFSSAFRSLFSALTRSCSIAVSLPTRSDHFSFSFTFNFAFNPRDLYSRGYKNNYYNNNNHHHHNHNTAFGQWHNNLITKADKPRNPLAAAPSFSPQKNQVFLCAVESPEVQTLCFTRNGQNSRATIWNLKNT